MEGKLNFYYWKNSPQEEVDFVVKEGLKVTQLIQVCYNPAEGKTKEREVRALLKGSQELHCKNLLVITADKEGEEIVSWFDLKGKVRYVPLWKWLLS